MSWINMFPYKIASRTLNDLYNKVKESSNSLDNNLLVHSINFEFIIDYYFNSLKRLLNAQEIVENSLLNLHSQQFCEIFGVKYEEALNNAKLPSLNSLSIIKSTREDNNWNL